MNLMSTILILLIAVLAAALVLGSVSVILNHEGGLALDYTCSCKDGAAVLSIEPVTLPLIEKVSEKE